MVDNKNYVSQITKTNMEAINIERQNYSDNMVDVKNNGRQNYSDNMEDHGFEGELPATFWSFFVVLRALPINSPRTVTGFRVHLRHYCFLFF
jgi:hypothetical protein